MSKHAGCAEAKTALRSVRRTPSYCLAFTSSTKVPVGREGRTVDLADFPGSVLYLPGSLTLRRKLAVGEARAALAGFVPEDDRSLHPDVVQVLDEREREALTVADIAREYFRDFRQRAETGARIAEIKCAARRLTGGKT